MEPCSGSSVPCRILACGPKSTGWVTLPFSRSSKLSPASNPTASQSAPAANASVARRRAADVGQAGVWCHGEPGHRGSPRPSGRASTAGSGNLFRRSAGRGQRSRTIFQGPPNRASPRRFRIGRGAPPTAGACATSAGSNTGATTAGPASWPARRARQRANDCRRDSSGGGAGAIAALLGQEAQDAEENPLRKNRCTLCHELTPAGNQLAPVRVVGGTAGECGFHSQTARDRRQELRDVPHGNP